MTDATKGDSRGVKNTPTIFINGTEMRTGFTPEQLQSAIEAALAGKKSS
jgi:protein-disulfide isomerase